MSETVFDTTNQLFTLAADLVNQTARNIFLTGKAGTGKTTFLKYIRETCPKQMAIVAPTGVAAINAGGVTIHSFFQLPFSPFVPATPPKGFQPQSQEISNPHSLVSRLRFTAEKKKVIQQLELLIIDEISMVRSDLLDAIDTVLRFVRRRPLERFGGVQLLFIGDMFQLPPVVREPEWKLLSDYYKSPYFFDSLVIREDPPLYIEFDKIYRQQETRFINLLNQVRTNSLNTEGFGILEGRYQPAFQRKTGDGYIILTTHNEQARNINHSQLVQLKSPAVQYEAVLENDFPANAFPADQHLVLKEGAQVMFIRNDSAEKGKRYYNGKIGIVSKLEENKIFVRCKEEAADIEVVKDKWENIRYSLDKTNQTMKEELLGSFTQFPLRLAWAITIHKSQGLTFEKAIIDAGEAFAPGQVYVALSRCTSLEGMILKSKVRTNSLFTDPRILEFTQGSASSATLQTELNTARQLYQLKVVKESFNYEATLVTAHELLTLIGSNKESFNKEALSWTEDLLGKLNLLQDTARKFHVWLDGQFITDRPPEEPGPVIDKTQKAAGHFGQEAMTLIEGIKKPNIITDSRQQAKEVNDLIKELFSQLSLSVHLCKGFNNNLDTGLWHERRRNFVLPVFTVNVYAGVSASSTDSPHPDLYQALKKQRDQLCAKKDLPVYMVASGSTLDEMSRFLPQNLEEMRKISGMGEVKTSQYGKLFLDLITKYCVERGLDSLIHEKNPKRERKTKTVKEKITSEKKKGDSHAESFRLFKEGKSLQEIAEYRKLALSTVEGHLTRFVASGDLDVANLVSLEKRSRIEGIITGGDSRNVSSIKQALGGLVSFSEVRWVMAARGLISERSTD